MARQFFQSSLVGGSIPRPMDARLEIPLQPMAMAPWSLPQQSQKIDFQIQPDAVRSLGWSSEFNSGSHMPEMHQQLPDNLTRQFISFI